jgi:hypothetical protein
MSEISVVKLECDEERMNKEFRLALQNAKKNSLNYADGGHESLLDLSIPRTPSHNNRVRFSDAQAGQAFPLNLFAVTPSLRDRDPESLIECSELRNFIRTDFGPSKSGSAQVLFGTLFSMFLVWFLLA